MKNRKEELRQYFWIENTRMLYDMMEELCNRTFLDDGCYRYIYRGEGGLKKRQILKDKPNNQIKKLLIECVATINGEKEYLFQNPLSRYLKYYNEIFGFKIDRSSFEDISSCLRYYSILMQLTKGKEDDDSLPYEYEDICLTIREMTQCEAVYIVYKVEGESGSIVSRSGFVFRSDDDLKSRNDEQDEIDELLLDMLNNHKQAVFPCGFEKNKKNHMIFEFEIPTQKEEKSAFYVILSGVEKGEEIEKDIALKILFMRNRLFNALERDYGKLLSLRFNCEYIKSVREKDDNKKGANEEETFFPTILHLSDSHLSELTESEVKDYINSDKFLESDCSVDLLAITGDIVNASEDASGAEINYKVAESVLRLIAKRLWGIDAGDNTTILPHDWRRRILIIPGNHDYSSMSDVVVEAESRKIKAAFPASRSSSLMSKFTYYIEFIARFLDVPIDDLVEHELNEIRHYRNLNLRVDMFNSVAQTNALQNNKVGFSEERIIKELLDRKKSLIDEKTYRIIMMHHSPNYMIDYFDDKYGAIKIKKELDKKNKELGKEFFSVYYKYSSALQRLYSVSITDVWIHFSKMQYTAKELEEKILLFSKKSKIFSESTLRKELEMVYRLLEKHELSLEYDSEFFHKNKSLSEIQRKDREEFNRILNEQIMKPDNKSIVLAGHEHKSFPDRRNNIEIHMVDKLYNGESYQYALLEYDKGKKQYNYQYYQYTP